MAVLVVGLRACVELRQDCERRDARRPALRDALQAHAAAVHLPLQGEYPELAHEGILGPLACHDAGGPCGSRGRRGSALARCIVRALRKSIRL